MRKAKGDIVDDIVQAILLGQEDTAFVDTQCIHVFNEDYVSSRVKIRDDGLNAIVLLGELGDLEDKILDLELRIETESNRNIELKKKSLTKSSCTNVKMQWKKSIKRYLRYEKLFLKRLTTHIHLLLILRAI